MSTLTHDAPHGGQTVTVPPRARLGTGLVLALVSAGSFGMSGALARGLIETGWSVGALVMVRIGIAALIVLPFGLVALRGHWGVLRANLRLITWYGVMAVAGAQFAYFSAVQHMQVGPALLIEYTAPAAVVVWMWLRHGQRPGPLTLVGAGLAALGLVLVLDLLSGADLSLPGVLWALGAMVGCATYFIVIGDDSNGLPPIVLASGGLVVGAAVIGVIALSGLLPMHATTDAATYAGTSFAWWQPVVVLGLFTAALAYVTGVAAGRLLGSRLASFVALTEVVAGVLWAWLLLDELPRTVQLLGGLLILAGVVSVKVGERSVTGVPAASEVSP
jgi:drug/metabolite transporter (DMT)-like permease